MSTCDILTTRTLQGVQKGCCRGIKHLFKGEPERRIELLTYALRVRFRWKLVESGGDTSATVKGFMHFSGTRWSHTEASGLTTKLTTLSDMYFPSTFGQALSPSGYFACCFSLVISHRPVPPIFGFVPIVAP